MEFTHMTAAGFEGRKQRVNTAKDKVLKEMGLDPSTPESQMSSEEKLEFGSKMLVVLLREGIVKKKGAEYVVTPLGEEFMNAEEI